MFDDDITEGDGNYSDPYEEGRFQQDNTTASILDQEINLGINEDILEQPTQYLDDSQSFTINADGSLGINEDLAKQLRDQKFKEQTAGLMELGGPTRTGNAILDNQSNEAAEAQTQAYTQQMQEEEEMSTMRTNLKEQPLTADNIRGMSEDTRMEVQKAIGVRPDGDFGPKSEAAYNQVVGMNAVEEYEGDKGLFMPVIANETNMPLDELKNLIRIESGGHGYDIKNPDSSAYGKYQFMTYDKKSTGYSYAKALGYTGKPGKDLRDWMTPTRQDKMFTNLTKDNMAGLTKVGIKPSAFTVYGAHQQGLTGLKEILAGAPFKQSRIKKMRANVPKKDKSLTGQALADAWTKHWKAETRK